MPGYQRHFDALAKPGLELWCAPPEQTDPVEAPSPSSTASAAFGCGDVVQLHGLEKQADLNGRKGRLLEWQSSSGRWSCLLHPEKRKRREVKQVLVNVRPCNVKAVQGEKSREIKTSVSWVLVNTTQVPGFQRSSVQTSHSRTSGNGTWIIERRKMVWPGEGKRPAVTKRRPVESQAKAGISPLHCFQTCKVFFFFRLFFFKKKNTSNSWNCRRHPSTMQSYEHVKTTWPDAKLTWSARPCGFYSRRVGTSNKSTGHTDLEKVDLHAHQPDIFLYLIVLECFGQFWDEHSLRMFTGGANTSIVASPVSVQASSESTSSGGAAVDLANSGHLRLCFGSPVRFLNDHLQDDVDG